MFCGKQMKFREQKKYEPDKYNENVIKTRVQPNTHTHTQRKISRRAHNSKQNFLILIVVFRLSKTLFSLSVYSGITINVRTIIHNFWFKMWWLLLLVVVDSVCVCVCVHIIKLQNHTHTHTHIVYINIICNKLYAQASNQQQQKSLVLTLLGA